MKTFFTSDTHFNSPRLVEQTRPWTSVEEHDDYVIDCINTEVCKNDRLIIIGDFCKKKPHKWRQRIRNRNIMYVLGNHDIPVTGFYNCFGKDRVKQILDIKVDGQKITCCHYPMAHWNCSHHGSYHVYGHVHGFKEDELSQAFPERRSMDIGVDNAQKMLGSPRPFEASYVIDYLSSFKGHGLIT